METPATNVCPCCDRGCPEDRLSCRKGMEHFGVTPPEGAAQPHAAGRPDPDAPVHAQALAALRQCGHYLHHNAGRDSDSAALLSGLSEAEQETLLLLLNKCLAGWKL